MKCIASFNSHRRRRFWALCWKWIKSFLLSRPFLSSNKAVCRTAIQTTTINPSHEPSFGTVWLNSSLPSYHDTRPLIFALFLPLQASTRNKTTAMHRVTMSPKKAKETEENSEKPSNAYLFNCRLNTWRALLEHWNINDNRLIILMNAVVFVENKYSRLFLTRYQRALSGAILATVIVFLAFRCMLQNIF